jgi:hypothetical protein
MICRTEPQHPCWGFFPFTPLSQSTTGGPRWRSRRFHTTPVCQAARLKPGLSRALATRVLDQPVALTLREATDAETRSLRPRQPDPIAGNGLTPVSIERPLPALFETSANPEVPS